MEEGEQMRFCMSIVCGCIALALLTGCRASPTEREARLSAEIVRLKSEIETLRGQSDATGAKPPVPPRTASPTNEEEPPLPRCVPIRAVVKAVDNSIKVVILNVGSGNKIPVKKGDRFFIYRDQTFVAMVKVTNVEKDMCAAKIVLPGLKVQVGDHAVTDF
jgi:hypothetical protein